MRAAWSTLALMALHAALCWLPAQAWVRAFSVLTLLSSLAHLSLASFGWLYRYDTYLVAANMAALALLLCQGHPRATTWRWLVLACAVGLTLPRAWHVWTKTPMAMDDRRWEHLMPAEFVKQLPKGTTIAVNDLGVFAFDGHARVIDVFGLGHNTPLRLRRSGTGYTHESISSFLESEGVQLAIVQYCWGDIKQVVPPKWELMGAWIGERNVVFNDKVVAVFRLDNAVPVSRTVNFDIKEGTPFRRLSRTELDHLCESRSSPDL